MENYARNLEALSNRTRWTTFIAREGSLKKVEGARSFLSYFWHQRAEKAQVRAVVQTFLEEVEEQANEEQIKNLFAPKKGCNYLDPAAFRKTDRISQALLPKGVIRLDLGEKIVDLLDSKGRGVVNFDLSPDETYNFHQLITRKKGVQLRLNSKGLLEKVKNDGAYRLEQKKQEEKIQGVVAGIIGSLEEKIPTYTEVHKLALRRIFTGTPLTRMNKRVYNRGNVGEGSELEGVLYSKLGEKREEFKNALQEASEQGESQANKVKVEAALIKFCLEEFRFAKLLGLDLIRVGDGGSGGARYGLNRYGKKLVVVKPLDEGPHGVNNPKWYARFKRLVVSPRSCLRGNSEPLAEVDAYALDRGLGINIVPPTRFEVIRSKTLHNSDQKTCSVQLYVEGCKTLGEHLGIPSWAYSLPRRVLRKWLENKCASIPQELFERLAWHNILIEDIDCHLDNVLIKADKASPSSELHSEDDDIDIAGFFKKNGNQKLLKDVLHSDSGLTFVKHDNGSSSPQHHPRAFLGLRFKHLFEVLPHAEKPFSKVKTVDPEAMLPIWTKKAERAIGAVLNHPDWKEVYGPSEKKTKKQHRRHLKLVYNWINSKFSITRKLVDTLMRDLYRDCSGYLELEMRLYLYEHLWRIEQMIRMREESMQLVNKAIDEGWPIRKALQVRSEKDFNRVGIGV